MDKQRYLYIFSLSWILISLICCQNKKPDSTGAQVIKPQIVDINDIKRIAEQSQNEYTLFFTYQQMCSYCRDSFPNIYNQLSSCPCEKYVIFTVRENDSCYISKSISAIKKIDNNFENFLMLSDSLYDKELRHLKKGKSIFKHYGGPIEGNKYFNFLDSIIPDGYGHEAYTPRIIALDKEGKCVYANTYNDTLESAFSQAEKNKLFKIINYATEHK